MSRLQRLIAEVHRRSLWQVLGIYLLGAWFSYEVILALFEGLGLPDWVPPLAIVLFLIGLPVVLATAFVQEGVPGTDGLGLRRRAAERPEMDPTLHPELAAGEEPPALPDSGPRIHPWKGFLTWNRALLAGVIAFAILGAGTAGYMGMRVLGIGPVGTLVAQGVLEARDPIVLADFESGTVEPGLAGALTQALRVDLEQSRVVALADPGLVRDVIRRMELSPEATLDGELAREVAARAGLKAVLAPDVNAAGGSFVLTARLLSSSGESLGSFRETARDSSDLLDAVDRLSKAVRERVGESLRALRRGEALAQVTTPSLAALERYSQAVHATEVEANHERAIALLEEAIRLDSAFAMAHRKLGVILANNNVEWERATAAMGKAFEYRDRLTDRERYITVGTFYTMVEPDGPKAITAYETLLSLYPDDYAALNNLALQYGRIGDRRRAEDLYRRAIQVNPSSSLHYTNLSQTQVSLGELDASEETLRTALDRFPENPAVLFEHARLPTQRFDYRAAEERLRALQAHQSGNLRWQRHLGSWLGALAAAEGRVREAEREIGLAIQASERLGNPEWALIYTAELARIELYVLERPEAAVARLGAALQRHPLDSIPLLDRPYLNLAWFYTEAGRTERARELLAEYRRVYPQGWQTVDRREIEDLRLVMAFREGSPEELLAGYRPEPERCPLCMLYEVAEAYKAVGQMDSALAYYVRYVETPQSDRLLWDSNGLGAVLERIAELYDGRGEAARAAEYYARFVELWERADPELQPRVQAARHRLQTLLSERG